MKMDLERGGSLRKGLQNLGAKGKSQERARTGRGKKAFDPIRLIP
jgi:hypothetical protein